MAEAASPPKLPSFNCSLLPFRALRFAPDHISDLGDLVVPPRASLYMGPDAEEGEGPPTVQRLFPKLDKLRKGSWDPRNRTEIASRYQAWRDQGHLRWQEDVGLYVHQTGFTTELGEQVTRLGFYAVVAVRQDGSLRILPHEQTLPQRVQRQVELFTWRGAQVLPLLVLFQDPGSEVEALLRPTMATPPTVAFRDSLEQDNSMWTLDEPAGVQAVLEWFRGKELMLADGHHRFEAARAYWAELRSQGEDSTPGLRTEDHGAEAYAVAYLTPAEAPGLLMGTFHRGLRLNNAEPGFISKQLDPAYELHRLPMGSAGDLTHHIERELRLQSEQRQHDPQPHPRFVMLCKGSHELTLLVRRRALAEETPATERLDVTELHHNLLPRLGEICHLEFQQEIRSLVEAVVAGRLDAAIFLNPPETADVWAVARSGVPMPPKATYFYPKLAAGLLHFPLARLVYQHS